MIKDLPKNIVEDVSIAVVLESQQVDEKNWAVYLINEKDTALTNVFVTSRGYGTKEGKKVKTSTLRHLFERVDKNSYVKIEIIDPSVFQLNNEYWLSYYIDKTIYDKKYIFLPDSIVDSHMIQIPLINKKGVLIGGN